MREQMQMPSAIRRRILAVYALVVLASFLISVAALATMRSLLEREDGLVASESAILIETGGLTSNVELMSASVRGYLLTGEPRLVGRLRAARSRFDDALSSLHGRTQTTDEHELLDEISAAEGSYNQESNNLTETPKKQFGSDELKTIFQQRLEPLSDRLVKSVNAFRALEHEKLDIAAKRSAINGSRSLHLVAGASLFVIVAAIALSIVLIRLLHALTRREEQLEKTNRDLDAFAGRIAHDLKNALAPLLLACGCEIGRRRLSDILKRRLGIAFGLVDGLLAFSRAGQPPPSGTAAVRSVVADVVNEFAKLASDLRASVECDCDDVRTACSPPFLQMIVANLVSNALKFLVGRSERRIRISAHAVVDECELVVEDSGPGIAQDEIPRIFEPFYRGSESAAPGTGIGLATVARMVSAHGGRILTESQPGKGTRFRIFLPLAMTPSTRLHSEHTIRH